jgi:hypothetical protein
MVLLCYYPITVMALLLIYAQCFTLLCGVGWYFSVLCCLFMMAKRVARCRENARAKKNLRLHLFICRAMEKEQVSVMYFANVPHDVAFGGQT